MRNIGTLNSKYYFFLIEQSREKTRTRLNKVDWHGTLCDTFNVPWFLRCLFTEEPEPTSPTRHCSTKQNARLEQFQIVSAQRRTTNSPPKIRSLQCLVQNNYHLSIGVPGFWLAYGKQSRRLPPFLPFISPLKLSAKPMKPSGTPRYGRRPSWVEHNGRTRKEENLMKSAASETGNLP